ncbi:acetolactate synthase small subunit [Ructibacterium gallinarum]|uniref:Acetolactate synthase small subunit n=1 Tax=Ructibacterium gallinarum TaxID=2779355 RepID=A0A9D5LYT3_9FIRM|nr:acetolactate synthase small subunit [Ructibacterium gallinarum]MBE5039030.1 acetolactate synthase small subunit [Ructibacterium gallinarum]
MTNTHVLSVLVENHAGVLSRVSGLFSRRMYNIDSLSVGVTENPDVSRMTIVTQADEDTLNQIKNQLAKLVNVLEITELYKDSAVLREHVLVKVSAKDRGGVMQICDIFRANIVDISSEYMTAELTGAPNKINAFIDLMEQYEVRGLVRTGLTGLKRG